MSIVGSFLSFFLLFAEGLRVYDVEYCPGYTLPGATRIPVICFSTTVLFGEMLTDQQVRVFAASALNAQYPLQAISPVETKRKQ